MHLPGPVSSFLRFWPFALTPGRSFMSPRGPLGSVIHPSPSKCFHLSHRFVIPSSSFLRPLFSFPFPVFVSFVLGYCCDLVGLLGSPSFVPWRHFFFLEPCVSNCLHSLPRRHGRVQLGPSHDEMLAISLNTLSPPPR